MGPDLLVGSGLEVQAGMLPVVHIHAAVPSRVGSIVLVLPCPQARPRRQNYAAICKAPEARAGDLRRAFPPRRSGLFLIFVSNGRNDIVNGQEGVHHFRIEKLP
jgi:hypothetical protein